MARSKPFPRLSPEYKEKSGWSTHNPTRKYLLLCISIYGPSIRKTPHTHIRHPVLHSAARHHRLPSSLSGRHPRRSHTLPPTVIDPLPPGSLRTLVRQKTLAIAHYFIYIHIYSFTPLPLHPRKASDASIYICLHPLTSFPPSVRKPRPGLSYAGKISRQSKVESSCRLCPSPPHPAEIRA